jgi:hypothetical protein
MLITCCPTHDRVFKDLETIRKDPHIAWTKLKPEIERPNAFRRNILKNWLLVDVIV